MRYIIILLLLIPGFISAQVVSRNKSFQFSGTSGVTQYSGNTAQRPSGDSRWLRWNSDSGRIEIKINSTTWRGLLFNGEGGGGGGGLSPSDTVGRWWSLAGNTLGATKNFGSVDNNNIQFIANNTIVGGLASNGEWRFGNNTDRGAFPIQLNGRTIIVNGASNNLLVEDDGANGANATTVLNIGSNALPNLLLTTPSGANTMLIRDYGQTTNLFTIGADNNVEFTHLLTDAATSGTKRAYSSQNIFNPTSGTAVRYAFEDATTVNQTGGANGIYASFYAHPTLTAAADARAFWNTVGNNKLNTTSGNTMVGTATDNGVGKLQVNGKVTIATVDSAASPANMLWIDPVTKEIKKSAVPSGSSGIDAALAADNEITTNRAIEIGLNNFNFTTSGADIFSFGPSETYSYKDHFFGAKVYFETMGGVIHTNVPTVTTQPTYKPLIDTATGQVLKVIEPKTYTALLSQSGSSAPTSTVLGTNTIGTIVWTRNSAGNYTGTLSAAFTSNKTWLIVQQGDQNGSFINSILSWTDASSLLLTTYDNVGNPSDGFSNMSIEIRVYP